jgi:2-phospho-L-lactate/phosphoenolpyruvate guanylyltransferase
MDAGIVPIRTPKAGKQRLLAQLSDSEREEVARALIDDAFDLMARCTQLDWWVVSDDAEVLERAVAAGHAPVRDGGVDLNAALSLALEKAGERGAEGALILPADLPLATPHDVALIMETAATSDIVIVPSGGDGGTNGLYISPVEALAPAFGRASLTAHITNAEALKLRATVLPLERLAIDLDSPGDIERLVERGGTNDGCTMKLLRSIAPHGA